MRLFTGTLFLIAILHCSYAPPVSPEKKEQDSEVVDDLAQFAEYHRYLKEVVQALESDPDFRERLEKANEDDIRSGKIAEQLDFVNHNVRSRLDEIKRWEIERLRNLATKQYELINDINFEGKIPSNEHLDHTNPHTFEIDDLKRLIKKTTADLDAADKKRREQFKEYEMEKEFDKHQKMESLDEAKKKEFEENMKKEEEAKKHHKPLHHPGSKQQLEEVWEKQDHMDQQFDPRAFFMTHDVDGNGVWDPEEVKALFTKELDKVYTPGGPNKDMHERAEEMERMREHVFTENDKNHDGLIDFNEFMMETQRADFNQDEGWKAIDENQIYTQAEYEAYERRRLEELRYLQQRGLVDAHGRPVPGAQHQIHQAYQEQQAAYQQQYQQSPGQFAQGQPQYGQAPHGYQQPQGHQQPQVYQQVPGQQGQPQYPGQPQGQPQFQGQQQAQPQFQGQPQGQQQFQGQPQMQQQFQGQPQMQQKFQGQPQIQPQYQGQPQGQPQYQGQPQGQPQYQGQPQGKPQLQAPQTQSQGQPQPQGQLQYQGQQPVQQPIVNVNQGQHPVQNPPQPAQSQPDSNQKPLEQAQGQVQGQASIAQNRPNVH